MVPATRRLNEPADAPFGLCSASLAADANSASTAGVDLAAQSRGTALAVICFSSTLATVTQLQVGVTDDEIADVAATVSAIGIDCAFGWPDDFIRFVVGHAAGDRLDRASDLGIDWRRHLSYRATDRDTRDRTGRWPLSVATDRLGLTAMHCAALLDLFHERFGTIDRSGAGLAAEVYPGAMLRLWGCDTRGYKTDAAARAALVSELSARAPWLQLGGFAPLMIDSDDAFDAVIAALGARANSLGMCPGPPAALASQASREGWIRLPTTSLEALMPVAWIARVD